MIEKQLLNVPVVPLSPVDYIDSLELAYNQHQCRPQIFDGVHLFPQLHSIYQHHQFYYVDLNIYPQFG